MSTEITSGQSIFFAYCVWRAWGAVSVEPYRCARKQARREKKLTGNAKTESIGVFLEEALE